MKHYVLSAIVALLLAGACWLFVSSKVFGLPRKQLADGGEFRVVQVTYGAGKTERHNFGRAPEPLFWMWHRLPASLQSKVSYPDEGLSASGHTGRVISIWWTWFDPSGKPSVGPTNYPVMTLDSGKQIRLGWPKPADDFRQLFVVDPPRDSRRLRFSLLVNEEQVEFDIANPAFER